MTDETPRAWPALSIAEAHALLTASGARYEMETAVIGGRTYRVWKHGPKTLVELFGHVRSFGEREFVVYEGERATYEAFARAVLVLARRLQADGISKGDRVALAMRNLPEWPVAFFAAALVGAVVTPLNAWWTGPELAYGLADSGARLAIVDAERLERIAPHLDACPALERLCVVRGGSSPGDARVFPLDEVIGAVADWPRLPDAPLPAVAIGPEDDAVILYTSGTTGKPKGALGTHRNVTTNVGTTGIAQARVFLRAGEPLPEADPHRLPQRVMLLVVPMFHVTGLSALMLVLMAGGGKLVLMRRWDAEAALQLIERERVNVTGGVPTIAWQLVEHPARANYDLSSLQAVNYGGAPAAPELVRRLRTVFPLALPGNGWGMTETMGTFTSHGGPDYEHRPTSAGPPAPIGEVRIRDPAGRDLPAGEVGELWVKGPQVAKGYWNRPEAAAQTFQDGWLATGDLARVDEEGFVFIVDRAKDMLIRGGENIYCVEVEDALYAHSDVMDAAVVGVPHRTLGEEPAAVVHLKPGGSATEADLRAFVAERLAAFKTPVRIVFWPETLPRNANGKILKTDLKKHFTGES